VDFEVLEDVAASGIIVIPKGSVAIAASQKLNRSAGRAELTS
jgi:hypothetical protein